MPKKRTETLEIPGATKITGNIHRVPLKLWRRWDENSRWMFNNMMRRTKNSWTMSHPGYEKIPAELWETLRWNFAVNAADLLREAKWIRNKVIGA